MSLQMSGARLLLKVRDNGVGFDVARLLSAPASVAAGIGLRSIREQAEALGGRFVVESGPAGTTLEVYMPLSGVRGRGRQQGPGAGIPKNEGEA
jgi:two-component system, NarL family, sensor kinase